MNIIINLKMSENYDTQITFTKMCLDWFTQRYLSQESVEYISATNPNKVCKIYHTFRLPDALL